MKKRMRNRSETKSERKGDCKESLQDLAVTVGGHFCLWGLFYFYTPSTIVSEVIMTIVE